MRDVTLLSMKNKSVHSCRFVQHAKFHCIMTTLKKLFKIEFGRWGGGGGGGNWKRAQFCYWQTVNCFHIADGLKSILNYFKTQTA